MAQSDGTEHIDRSMTVPRRQELSHLMACSQQAHSMLMLTLRCKEQGKPFCKLAC